MAPFGLSLFSKSNTTDNTSQNASAKKGEINELYNQLSENSIMDNAQKRKELLQKVIFYTTLGYDTSKLFNRIIMLVHTNDIIQKKMVYQYVTGYANTNPELAILTINTLSNDCRDDSPLIRGLALRHLASLRSVPKITEHLLPLIKEGLNDPSSYVRRTAVLSIIKLNRISSKLVEKEQFVDRLYTMIRDKDSQVVVNCIYALNELLKEEGGMKAPKKLVYYLLNQIAQYDEWQLGTILEVMLKYRPKDNKELFTIMNLLDDKLSLSNAHVILGITNVFLQYSEDLPKIHQKVYMRLKEPLLLLLSMESPELQYTVLKHIKIMVERCPEVFHNNHTNFFFNRYEPTYIKLVKLEILVLCATNSNVKQIMDELSYYVALNHEEDDIPVSRMSIRTLGMVAVKVSAATEVSLSHLLDFLDLKLPHVVSEIFIVLKDILRKYSNPDFCSIFLPQITKHWKLIDDDQSKVAFIWILGEFGGSNFIPEAPYILETFINTFKSHHYSIRLEILASAMKLFFKRPPEMQQMLGQLFEISVGDASHADVHDRALLYYRLLEKDITLAEHVICGNKKQITDFAEEEGAEYKDRLFNEFNTLSIIYNKPSEMFIVTKPDILGDTVNDFENEDDNDEQNEEEVQESINQDLNEVRSPNATSTLLSFEEETSQVPRKFTLLPVPTILQPEDFEMLWENSGDGGKMSWKLTVRSPVTTDDVEVLLQEKGFQCIASSSENPLTFYFYGQSKTSGEYILLEVKIFQNGPINILIKQENNDIETIEKVKPLLYESLEGKL